MQFASDIVDKLHLPPGCNTDCSGNPNQQTCTVSKSCGPRTYEQRIRVQRNRLSATYTGTAVTKISGSTPTSGDYMQLKDGGNPVGVVQYTTAGGYKLVNTPVYITPPSNPVSSTIISTGLAGPTFNVTTTSSNCCSC